MIEVLRRGERPWLIGHRGAAAVARENTLDSLGAAVEHGVDIVEFDVLDRPDGVLVLAHSEREIAPGAPTLDDALAFLAAVPERTGVHLDLKRRGFEHGVVDAVRRHGLEERTLVSSSFVDSLRTAGELGPEIRRAFSYPYDRYELSRRRALTPAVAAAVLALRQALPLRIGAWLERSGATVASLHYRLVSRAVVDRCHARGAAVFAWTVDRPASAARLVRVGADGIITNDPRLVAGILTA